MNVIFTLKQYPRKHNAFKRLTLLLCIIVLFAFTTACKQTINYFDYVSELRSNIVIAKTESLSLRIYATVKESPYTTDGIPRETFPRMEAHLITPEGNKTVEISMAIGENTYGGEMSYDFVKGEYYYAHSIDVSSQKSIVCHIQYGEEKLTLTASSVITENTIHPNDALKKLQTEKSELFSSMTDKYGFAGEIYLRLLFEDSPYYYIGVIDRQGKCTAFLMNAETGKILAERIS